jgi:hypothetical protein
MTFTAAPNVLITPATLRTSKWRFVMHLNMGRVHVTNRECVDFEGLTLSDSYDRKMRTTTRTFFVAGDTREFETVQDAARAWNDQHRRWAEEAQGSEAA